MKRDGTLGPPVEIDLKYRLIFIFKCLTELVVSEGNRFGGSLTV